MADIRKCCFGRIGRLVLPAVYDEALSYQDLVYSLCQKINEIIDELSQSDEDFYNYVDRSVANAINQCNNYTDQQINKTYSEILLITNDLRNYVDSQNAGIRSTFSAQINDIWQYLYNLPTGTDIVIDPTTGLPNSLQNTLNNMWQALSYSLTCQEYANLGFTCDEYEAEDVTCFQYAWYGKFIWLKRLYRPLFYMTHPYTGLTVFYQEVINWLASFHMEECPTCDEYEGLDHTCAEYNALNLTCYEYVSKGRTILGIAIPPTGDISLATVEEVKNIIGE